MHPEEVRARAKRGLIPGAKTGKRWIFLEADLAEFVRSLYPGRRQALRVTTISQENLCHYANAGRSGGSTSLRPTASAYDDLLKPATKPRRKSCTIS
ncbi:MAG: helix-turn-helix domain-containing protein [Pseudomonadota bacterium]|nr:helix-turn-helix domain-containing protein [Pseudomonadota bacterium]